MALGQWMWIWQLVIGRLNAIIYHHTTLEVCGIVLVAKEISVNSQRFSNVSKFITTMGG